MMSSSAEDIAPVNVREIVELHVSVSDVVSSAEKVGSGVVLGANVGGDVGADVVLCGSADGNVGSGVVGSGVVLGANVGAKVGSGVLGANVGGKVGSGVVLGANVGENVCSGVAIGNDGASVGMVVCIVGAVLGVIVGSELQTGIANRCEYVTVP